MLDKEQNVQGLSVYAEFSKPGFRTEMFITPDGFTPTGDLVPATVFTRVVSKEKPKKLWRQTTIQFADEIAKIGEKELDLSQKEQYLSKRLEHLTSIFEGVVETGWEITSEPMLIETSLKDLQEVAKGETPIRVVYRINQSRKALGLPAEIA
jgi:hypothetical protein